MKTQATQHEISEDVGTITKSHAGFLKAHSSNYTKVLSWTNWFFKQPIPIVKTIASFPEENGGDHGRRLRVSSPKHLSNKVQEDCHVQCNLVLRLFPLENGTAKEKRERGKTLDRRWEDCVTSQKNDCVGVYWSFILGRPFQARNPPFLSSGPGTPSPHLTSSAFMGRGSSLLTAPSCSKDNYCNSIRGVASIYARTPVRTTKIWEKIFII